MMHILYMDNLQVYVQISRDQRVEGIGLLEQVASLKLNAGKTKAILFGPLKIFDNLDKAGIALINLPDEEQVPFSDTTTSLGAVLDSKLSSIFP